MPARGNRGRKQTAAGGVCSLLIILLIVAIILISGAGVDIDVADDYERASEYLAQQSEYAKIPANTSGYSTRQCQITGISERDNFTTTSELNRVKFTNNRSLPGGYEVTSKFTADYPKKNFSFYYKKFDSVKVLHESLSIVVDTAYNMPAGRFNGWDGFKDVLLNVNAEKMMEPDKNYECLYSSSAGSDAVIFTELQAAIEKELSEASKGLLAESKSIRDRKSTNALIGWILLAVVICLIVAAVIVGLLFMKSVSKDRTNVKPLTQSQLGSVYTPQGAMPSNAPALAPCAPYQPENSTINSIPYGGQNMQPGWPPSGPAPNQTDQMP